MLPTKIFANNFEKNLILLFIILVIFFSGCIESSYTKKDCGEFTSLYVNEGFRCMSEVLLNCGPAILTLKETAPEGGEISSFGEYEILGEKDGKCIARMKIIQHPDSKKRSKEMICEIEKFPSLYPTFDLSFPISYNKAIEQGKCTGELFPIIAEEILETKQHEPILQKIEATMVDKNNNKLSEAVISLVLTLDGKDVFSDFRGVLEGEAYFERVLDKNRTYNARFVVAKAGYKVLTKETTITTGSINKKTLTLEQEPDQTPFSKNTNITIIVVDKNNYSYKFVPEAKVDINLHYYTNDEYIYNSTQTNEGGLANFNIDIPETENYNKAKIVITKNGYIPEFATF